MVDLIGPPPARRSAVDIDALRHVTATVTTSPHEPTEWDDIPSQRGTPDQWAKRPDFRLLPKLWAWLKARVHTVDEYDDREDGRWGVRRAHWRTERVGVVVLAMLAVPVGAAALLWVLS